MTERAPDREIWQLDGGLGLTSQVKKIIGSYSNICRSPGVARLVGNKSEAAVAIS